MDINHDDTGMYYYTRPIGVYAFAGVFALALIVQATITWTAFVIAILWGIMAWGFGNLLWAAIGDIVTPYIHKDQYEQVDIEEYPESPQIPSTPLQNPEHEFDRHINRVISDHKLWARGMVVLTGDEEDQLHKYIRERWFSIITDTEIPEYISNTLVVKMEERNLISNRNLTTYGEAVIPCKTATIMMP